MSTDRRKEGARLGPGICGNRSSCGLVSRTEEPPPGAQEQGCGLERGWASCDQEDAAGGRQEPAGTKERLTVSLTPSPVPRPLLPICESVLGLGDKGSRLRKGLAHAEHLLQTE